MKQTTTRLWLAIVVCFTLNLATKATAIDASKQKIRPEVLVSKNTAKTFAGEHLLVNVFLNPRLTTPQNIRVEVTNKLPYEVALLEFRLRTFGNYGKLEFSNLSEGGQAVQAIRATNVKKPRLGNFTIIDSDANSRFDRVIVQFIATTQTEVISRPDKNNSPKAAKLRAKRRKIR